MIHFEKWVEFFGVIGFFHMFTAPIFKVGEKSNVMMQMIIDSVNLWNYHVWNHDMNRNKGIKNDIHGDSLIVTVFRCLKIYHSLKRVNS